MDRNGPVFEKTVAAMKHAAPGLPNEEFAPPLEEEASGLRSGALTDTYGRYMAMVALVFGTVNIGVVVALRIFWADLDPFITGLIYSVLVILQGMGSIYVARSVGTALDRIAERQADRLETADIHDIHGAFEPELGRFAPELAEACRGWADRLSAHMARLDRLAHADAVTGLPNRLSLEESVRARVAGASHERPLALILVDIDRFARIQDVMGADLAERLLAEFSERMTAELATIMGETAEVGDELSFYRVGSDEFVALVSGNFSRDRVAGVAEALRRRAREPFEINGRWVRVSLSAGIVLAPDDGDTCAELIRNAELALADARTTGLGSLKFFTPRLNRIVKGRVRFERELRQAVANGEFAAVYQPKVDVRTGRIVGAEALVRWLRPAGKPISPAAFIPVAEELGLIREIGSQMVNAACREARRWIDIHPDCPVAVNVSPRQLDSDAFTREVVDVLCETGLPPNLLELEITESLAVSNPRKVAELMRPLRTMGVRLAIDDFGSGHANLSLLTQMPFDIFKIDRHFVSALEVDDQAPAVIELILGMAETLGLATVAEGVETPVQIDFLKRRGCTVTQGYYYSPPVSAEEFRQLLQAGKLPLAAAEKQKAAG